MRHFLLLLICLPVMAFGQTTLFSYDFGTSYISNLTGTGQWCGASPNSNTSSSPCTGYCWVGDNSSEYLTTKAIVIPSTATTASLSFNYKYNSSLSSPTVGISGLCSGTFTTLATLPSASSCTPYTIDLSAYIGQTIYIRFDANYTSSFTYFSLDDILVSYTTVVVPTYSYWVTSITGSGYTGTLNVSPPDNSTVYACWGSGLTLNSNMTANTISSGGKTYYRKWQYSDDGITFYVPGSPPSTASCATSGFVASRYYRIIYSYSSSSTDILYPSPWVHVILGPSSVANPTNLTTTNITPTSFTANWTSSATVCAGGGLGIIHRIDVATDASFSNMVTGFPKDVTNCITNGATTCSYDVTGLTTGLTYYWRIKAMSYHVGTNTGDLYCGVNSNYVPTSFNLPVELIGLSAVCNETTVTLSWSTATETNNDYFSVEKSINAEDWVPVGIVNGAGNSNELINYEFEDTEPMSGTSYYRLKQTDFDGKFEYFGPVTVNCNDDATGIIAYPNPAQENVLVVGSQDVAAEIYLCDLTGRIITSYSCSRLSEPFSIDLRNILPGVYLIRVDSQNSSEYFRVVKE